MSAKENLIEACIKGGKTKDECIKLCADAFPIQQNDADLMRENELLKGQIKKKDEYLSQAIDIANKANNQAKARDDAEIADLIDKIKVDSNNRMNADTLKGKSLQDLRLIKTTLDVSREDTFASVAAVQAERDKRNAPLLTVGKWDSAKQQWIGGF